MSGGEWLEGIIRQAHGWDSGPTSGWARKAELPSELPPDSSPSDGYDRVNTTEERVLNKTQKAAAAEAKLKAAEARLEEARKEATKAKAQALALEADRLLNKAARAVWDVAAAMDHAEWLHSLEGSIDSFRDEIALRLLDAGPRVEGLALLDADRWGPGEFSTGDPRSFTDDDDLYPTIATWVFDRTGVRGYEQGSDDYDYTTAERCRHDEWLASYQEQIEAAFLEATGDAARAQEIAEQSIAYWRAGRHDT